MATSAAAISYGSDEGPLDWIKRAACLDVPLDVFFPLPGDESAIAFAKGFCRQCPVSDECLEYELQHEPRSGADVNEDLGIYGGLTYTERRSLVRRRRETRRIASRKSSDG